MPASIYFNVIISGVLTGLVYGLMALGLSVIFGVVRVVNFAHGEMMAIAMYLAIVLFNTLGVDPLVLVIPLAGVLFVLGCALQAGIINPFISRPSIASSSCCCHRHYHHQRSADVLDPMQRADSYSSTATSDR